MSRIRLPGTIFLSFFVVTLLLPAQEARAYIDPGSGSYVIQVLIAGLVTAGAAIKIFWRNIKGCFKRRSPEPKPADNEG